MKSESRRRNVTTRRTHKTRPTERRCRVNTVYFDLYRSFQRVGQAGRCLACSLMSNRPWSPTESVTGSPVIWSIIWHVLLDGLIAVHSRVRLQRSFDYPIACAKHLFVDPAPAFEESPDLFGRHVTIRYSTTLRDMARPNQTGVVSVKYLDLLSNSD